jgi:ribosomal protein S18 acetylase RimI-like enzyme
MIIRRFRPHDRQAVTALVAQFRVALAAFRGITRQPNLDAADIELDEYIVNSFPIFVALGERARGAAPEPAPADPRKKLVGYLVCRVQEEVVWAESMYVDPTYRRRGIGSRLYREAEKIAVKFGSDTVYNWVHPNNGPIIAFLQGRGYTVLNLLEIRKPRHDEPLSNKIEIMGHHYDY